MKAIRIKLLGSAVLALVILSFTACTEDSSTETINEAPIQDITDIQRSSEIDAMDMVLEDFVINAFQMREGSTTDRSAANVNLPSCVLITATVQQNSVVVTIDFGTQGCLVNGNLLRGQIQMAYTRNMEAQQILISYTLVDFYFNNNNVLATRTILRERSNANGNPQFIHTLDVTVIWPDGSEASRSGQKVREWIAGVGSGTISDNVFLVTGYWISAFRNGNTHQHEVVIPLRREMGCPHFVSGSVHIERPNFTGVLDYGEGDCDNLATFTFNDGTEITITLN